MSDPAITKGLTISKGLTIVREAYTLGRAPGHAAAIGTIRAVVDTLGDSDAEEAVRLIRQVLAEGGPADG